MSFATGFVMVAAAIVTAGSTVIAPVIRILFHITLVYQYFIKEQIFNIVKHYNGVSNSLHIRRLVYNKIGFHHEIDLHTLFLLQNLVHLC